MASLEELRSERLKKLERLRAAGVNPYPTAVRRDQPLGRVAEEFDKFAARTKPLSLAGRVRSIRGQGGVIFFDWDDGTGRLQGLVKKDALSAEAFALFEETVDAGDFIEARGKLFLTKRGEKTLAVTEWRMLAKSLRPLPDEWYGLADVEERFRRRYLDSLLSEEVKKRFLLRSRLTAEIRQYLNREGFLEVETPMLQPTAGGAIAAPFVTHHQALDLDLYLRIAPELYLKEMLVGGFNKVYELGRSFRNEGIDATHNPEFTSLEVYESFSTPEEQRQLIAGLFRHLIAKALDGREISYQGHPLNFNGEIPTVPFADILQRYTLINDLNLDDRELELKARQFGLTVAPGERREKIFDQLYKKVCRPRLLEPVFIVDYPAAFSPLAKRQDERPDLIDRFQLVAGGLELVNGFAELNDPVEQAERFAEQETQRAAGDAEAHGADRAYVEALEYGLPPACGWGLGLDRLAMLLTNTTNIKEVIFFPTLKPRQHDN